MADAVTEANVEQLLTALDAWCVEQGFDADRHELAVWAAASMADFRAALESDSLTSWSSGEVVDYLLSYVPYAVNIEPDDLERFPAAVADVFDFLGVTGRLDPEVASGSANGVTALTDAFVLEAGNPASFGPSKALFGAMAKDGVDTTDQGAVSAWMEHWNSLSIEERRRLPMALPGEPRTESARRPAAKRPVRARKAQRQARRRNRRR